MKKFALLILIISFCCVPAWGEVDIDEDNFPDSAFRSYVARFDTNNDDILDDDELEAVTVIPAGFTYTVSNEPDRVVIRKSNYSFPSKISDFTGIDNFVNLETFACYNNNIEELDVSYNENLVALFCSGNSLSELDVSDNAALKYLECDNNKISDIYIPYDDEAELIYLSCNSNDITDLGDVPPSLQYLYFAGNDVEDAYFIGTGTALRHIWCNSNLLEELDVSSNTALQVLHCENNSLPELDLSSNSSLNTLVSNPQIIANQEISEGVEDDYPYAFDLSYLIYNGTTEDVTNIRAYDSNDATVQIYRDVNEDPDTVNFASQPARLLYDFETGRSNKVLEVTVLFGTAGGLRINSTNFPDNNFRNHISNNFDSDNDGFLSPEEISNITAIPAGLTVTTNSDGSVTPNYSSSLTGVSSLTGIENFTSLKNLGIDSNSLSSLSLGSNTKLEALFCKSNSLSSLNLSSNTALKYLDCSSNNLTELDLSANTALTYLNCSSNLLSVLDLSSNSSLSYANCSSQTVESQQSLTPTGDSTYLWQFDFKTLVTASNVAKISSVTATDSADNSITVSFNANTNGIAQFVTAPTEAVYNYSTGYSDRTMDVTVTFSAPALPTTGIQINETNFSDDVFRTYVTNHFDTNADGFLSASEIANVTSIPVNYSFTTSTDTAKSLRDKASGLENVRNFAGLENFTSLVNLGADGNSLSKLDVSKNTLLEVLVCNNNELNTLDVSKNTSLKYLVCASNKLTAIDVSKNTALIYLDCSENDISSLSVSANTALEYLYFQDNDVSSIDLSGNTALKALNCTSNDIKTLDLSNNTSITSFSGGNQNISAQVVNPTVSSDTTYSWEFHFSVIGASADKVSNVKAYDSADVEITTSYSDGIAKFVSQPSKVTYDYATGFSSYALHITFEITEAPEIITTSLPNGTTGTAYNQTVYTSVSGNLTWRISNGSLPTGLTLNSTSGVISGTPTVAGTYGFTITVSNGNISSSKSFTITIESSVINESVAPSILTANLTAGRVGIDYSAALTATGTTPITWTLSSGSLPDGLSLSASGVITGRPTKEGNFSFTVQASNNIGNDTKELSITIGSTSSVEKPSITTGEALPNATVGKAYRTVIYSMGTKPVTWSKSEGTLPPGLTLSASGVITGTPSAVGTYIFTVTAVNSIGNDSKQFSIVVAEDLSGYEIPAITSETDLGTIKENQAFNYTFTAAGTTPITWRLLSGRFPDGLVLNSNGTITGTPLATGNFTFRVQATNAAGSDTKTFRLIVESNASQNEPVDPTPTNPTPETQVPFIVTENNRKLSSLTTEEKNIATSGDKIIAAILNEVKVNVSGTYSFDVEISKNVPNGYELVWFSFPRQGSTTNNTYAYFTDLSGNEITVVSADKHIKAYAYLTPNVYGPVISAQAPSNTDNNDNTNPTPTPDNPKPENKSSGGGGGGGCNAGLSGIFSVMILLMARKKFY